MHVLCGRSQTVNIFFNFLTGQFEQFRLSAETAPNTPPDNTCDDAEKDHHANYCGNPAGIPAKHDNQYDSEQYSQRKAEQGKQRQQEISQKTGPFFFQLDCNQFNPCLYDGKQCTCHPCKVIDHCHIPDRPISSSGRSERRQEHQQRRQYLQPSRDVPWQIPLCIPPHPLLWSQQRH